MNKNKCIILFLFWIFLLLFLAWLFKISDVCSVKGIHNREGLQKSCEFCFPSPIQYAMLWSVRMDQKNFWLQGKVKKGPVHWAWQGGEKVEFIEMRDSASAAGWLPDDQGESAQSMWSLISSQEDREKPPPPPPNVAIYVGDLLCTPFPRMWRLKLGSKKQWPVENNCLHRLTTYKD